MASTCVSRRQLHDLFVLTRWRHVISARFNSMFIAGSWPVHIKTGLTVAANSVWV